jgi:hypothetical protein
MEFENEIFPTRTYPPILSILSSSLMYLGIFSATIPHTSAFSRWS